MKMRCKNCNKLYASEWFDCPSCNPINKRYLLKEQLGKGGIGQAWLASDIKQNKEVVLKFILYPKELEEEEKIKLKLEERFEREIEILKKLEHPNIVKILENCSFHPNPKFSPIPFYVMEYFPGKTLESIVEKSKQDDVLPPIFGAYQLEPIIKEEIKLPLMKKIEIICVIANALHYLHEQKLVHRDIHPGNILIPKVQKSKSQKPKLIDFGLVQIFYETLDEKRLTSTSSILGVLTYMAPEQLENPKNATPQSDIFSLGGVLYYLLTNTPAIDAQKMNEAYENREHHKKKELLQIVHNSRLNFPDEIDEELQEICCKALAKNPAQRYQTAQEMEKSLKKYLELRKKWKSHFLKSTTNQKLSIQNKSFLTLDDQGKWKMEESKEARKYVEFRVVGTQCDFKAIQPIKINKSEISENKFRPLYYGDILAINETKFVYKTEEFSSNS